ncbi:hypothetical protein FHG87_012480 [Trinorchestia longiramus]|nr:hypothetical protein FHG87_012480 [Trinorchestia longiramus]
MTSPNGASGVEDVVIRMARTTYEHNTNEASFRRPLRTQDNGSESSDEARFLLHTEVQRRPMIGSAQAAAPSQLPYIRRLQRSVSRNKPQGQTPTTQYMCAERSFLFPS